MMGNRPIRSFDLKSLGTMSRVGSSPTSGIRDMEHLRT